MVRMYSSCVFTLLIIRSALCLDCGTPVSSCPCSEDEWEKRSSIHNCTDLSYTCMLTFNKTLMEACVYDHPIKPAATGCPTIYSCVDSLPLITIEADFALCPIDKQGCPPADHTGYSLTKLYKFPECIRRNASSACSNNVDTIIEREQNGSLKVALGVLVPICVLAFGFGAFFFCFRRRFQTERSKENTRLGFMADYTHVPRSNVDHYENVNTPISDAEDLDYTQVPISDVEHFGGVLQTDDTLIADYIPAPTYPSDVEYYGIPLLLSSGDVRECSEWLTRAKEKFPGEINGVINYMEKNTGSTPLSEAIYWEKKDIVALLLKEGADFEVLNEMNENPIQQAMFHTRRFRMLPHQQSQNIAKFLEKLLAERDHLHFIQELVLSKYVEKAENTKLKFMTDAKFNRFKDVVEKAIQEYKEIPQEIRDMGQPALSNYRQNIKRGSLPSYYIRCMVVGHYGVGKTTLVRGLLNKDQSDIQSTDGIDVYREMCYIKRGRWEIKGKDNTFHTEDILGLKGVIQVDFWDFAGQAVYYSTHPTYFSDRCLYLLVINVALSSTDEVDDMDMDPSRASRRNVMDFLTYWIGTILHYSGHTKDGYPKIIIIGTHIDQVEDQTKIASIDRDIKNTFKEYIRAGQLICSIDHFVNAKSMSMSHRDRIRDLIEEHGKTYPNFGYKIPKYWIDLQRKLRSDYKDRNVNIISMGNLIGISETLGTQMRDEDLSLFLEFYTSLGQMLYFKESRLNDHTILEPMWLINAMKCLITKEERLKHVHELGKITKEEILLCFETEDPQYIENQEHIMKVLDKLDLVCNPRTYDEHGNRLMPNFYYIPSIFTESGLSVPDPKSENIEQIVYSFEKQILPPAVYHRLVCSFLSTWQVHEKHLYCETIQLHVQDDILVRFRRQHYQFVVTVFFLQERSKEDIVDVTNRVHSYILQACDRIIKSYTRNSENKGPTIHYEGDIPLQTHYQDDYEDSLLSSTESISFIDTVLSESECKTELTDIHLLNICLYLTLEQQEDILRRLPRLKTEYQMIYVNVGQRFLIGLNEWRTSVINDGEHVVAGLLKGIIDEEVLHKALNHKLPEVSSLPDEVKSRQVTDEFLDTVAYRIGAKYFMVGVSLGLEIDEVIVIASNNPQKTLKINQEILQTWSMKERENGRIATYGTLASVFIDANCRIDDFPEMSSKRRKKIVFQ